MAPGGAIPVEYDAYGGHKHSPFSVFTSLIFRLLEIILSICKAWNGEAGGRGDQDGEHI